MRVEAQQNYPTPLRRLKRLTDISDNVFDLIRRVIRGLHVSPDIFQRRNAGVDDVHQMKRQHDEDRRIEETNRCRRPLLPLDLRVHCGGADQLCIISNHTIFAE